MKQSPSPRRGAFTLLELVIVVAVLSVIAAMLLPTLGKVRSKAQTARCASTLRAIATGLTNYVADKGFYPGRITDRRPTVWHEALEPYMTGGPTPPSATPASPWARCPARKGLPAESHYSPLGYGYNMYFGNIPLDHASFDPDSPFNAYWRLKPANVRHPSRVIVIGDNRDDHVSTGFVISALRSSSSAHDPVHPRRHAGGGNFLFADGHIEWMTPAELTRRINLPGTEILIP